MAQNKIVDLSVWNKIAVVEEEIDFLFILSVVWKDKILIILLCLLFASCAYAVSLVFPNQYKATVVLAPAQKDGGGQLGGLASQYGGLAAMAGISVGKESDKTEQAIVLIKSWPFLEYVIGKYNLGADVLAAKGFDKNTKRLLYDEDLFDEKNKVWVFSKFKDSGGGPTSWMLYKKLSGMISVQNDKKAGLVTLSVTHVSPIIAKYWLELLTRELNLHFQLIDKEDAKRNIVYLEKKISETSVAEMQNVFFGMVEAQTKVLMLTERSEDYLFRILVRPMVPEEKSFPKRVVFLLLGFFAGFVFWCCIAVVRMYLSSSTVNSPEAVH